MHVNFPTLLNRAKELAQPYRPSNKAVSGQVGTALSTPEGDIYTGISVNTPCSLGFCGEHAAVAVMMADKKAVIHSIVSVDDDGEVMPPCGRCRQLLLFLHKENRNTKIYVNNSGDFATLSELMPHSKGA
ncbi:cytidine deaminase family protein [Vibrio owensii]|uniref:cytidine deaminase family protein n=1 Tax=Vibrio owensii TaxID=696485 RepID=UPI00374A571C